jgi:site-specific DNA recombinase
MEVDKPKHRVGIYCRISYNKSGEPEGVSRQEKLCRQLAKERGWEVVEVYDDDDKSAWQFSVIRGEYNRLLADLEAGVVATNGNPINGIIFYHMDRVAKRALAYGTLCDIYERKPSYVSASVHGYIDLSDPIGRGMGGFQVQIGGGESSATSRRLKDYYSDQALKGITYANYPAFGWNKDGTLNAKAELLRKAVHDVLAGIRPTSITKRWREDGIVTERGKRWNSHALTRILRAPRIAGIAVYKGEPLRNEDGTYIMGQWEPLVDESTWRELCTILAPNSPRKRASKSLSGGIARCGKCGCKMVRIRRSDTKYSYACQSKDSGGCASVSISGNRLDEQIITLVKAYFAESQVRAVPQLFQGQARLDEIATKIAELMAEYNAGNLSGSRVLPWVKKLEDEERELQAAKTKHNGRIRRSENINESWPEDDLEKQRAVLRQLFEGFIVRPSGRTGDYNSDRVEVIWRKD